MVIRTVLCGAALLAVGTVSTFAAPAGLSAKSVALQLSDVGGGFKQTGGSYISNANMAKLTGISKAMFDSHGRITGYESLFARGSTQIRSDVFTYKSAAGATWDYGQSTKNDLVHGKQVSAPTIGTMSIAVTESGKIKGQTMREYFIDFHGGTVDATVAEIAPPGQASLSSVVRLARIVAGRTH